ncbi:hypothetical protein R8Z57_08825 [Microbacterium sp. M3]|uniref:DUF3558 domain-containing protein n=1 Tax=Microbacterium arthrosphaerae TaxID=792652 RepID=A0ABU4H0M8_9MICO|nr:MULTISPECIES: hypothetical protein [Microbacterium]MDW4572875.1 hypothetical protein [Microbacterium arthrosphaerae]MDW7606730.1 hypothetical protein [Microbacterium sp. M3]
MIRNRIRVSSAVVALLASVIAVSACAAGGEGPTPSATVQPSATTSASPTSDPTPEPTAAAPTLPTDCNDLGTPETWQETVGDMTLQSNGEGFVRPAPAGATLALGCDWIVGDATGMLLLISTATPEAVSAAVAELPAEGYTCQMSDDFGAQFCVLPGPAPDTEEMIVARDGVWIYLSTVNRNGRALLSEIVQSIFA